MTGYVGETTIDQWEVICKYFIEILTTIVGYHRSVSDTPMIFDLSYNIPTGREIGTATIIYRDLEPPQFMGRKSKKELRKLCRLTNRQGWTRYSKEIS